jgi:hypothetical protein
VTAPVVAITKTLRDGRTCTVTVKEDAGAPIAITAIDGEELGRSARAFQLAKPYEPGLTHAIWAGRKQVLLTAAEADQVNQAVAQLDQDIKAERETKGAEEAERVRTAAPDAPTWKIQDGSGYGGSAFRVGQTLREPYKAPGEARIVTVLTASQRYFSDDGMSFGVGDDQGYVYMATVREATPEEAAPIRAAEERAELTDRLGKAARERFGWLYAPTEDATTPDEVPGNVLNLPCVQVVPPWRQRMSVSPDFLAVDETAGLVYSLSYNGADGDNWSYNNLPGYVVAVQPLTSERAELIAQLREHFN